MTNQIHRLADYIINPASITRIKSSFLGKISIIFSLIIIAKLFAISTDYIAELFSVSKYFLNTTFDFAIFPVFMAVIFAP